MQLAKMSTSIDLKFVELTADVLEMKCYSTTSTSATSAPR